MPLSPKPHEDGGAYFAAVATVSLGSHTLLDIYRYADETQSDGTQEKKARSREQAPRFSILQEPRSLLITRGAAYTYVLLWDRMLVGLKADIRCTPSRDFLHGIAERTEDDAASLRHVINKEQLTDDSLKQAVEASKMGNSGVLPRETRLSLTFRDVEKVAPRGLANMLNKR